MKRILISAFSCQPGKGSEPGVGWNWALQCAVKYDTWVLTRTKMEPFITPCIPEEQKERLHFCYVDSSKHLRTVSIYLEYLAWQQVAYREATALCQKVSFDYVWHLTWGNFFLPTDLDRLNIPFVWGPCGAAEQIPTCFWKRSFLPERLGHMTKYYLGKHIMLLPWVRRGTRNAVCLIARTSSTREVFPEDIRKKTITRQETVVSDKDFIFPRDTQDILHNRGTINLCYTGRLIGTKNVIALLDAMKVIRSVHGGVRLHILGEGGQRKRLERYARQNGLGNIVSFYGNVSRPELLRAMESCDAFLFPSLKEGASWSLLEAMFYEKPIVAFDTNGIHDTLSADCSVLAMIDETNAEKTNQNFTKAVLQLLEMPEKDWLDMGKNGKKRLQTQFYAESFQLWLTDLFE